MRRSTLWALRMGLLVAVGVALMLTAGAPGGGGASGAPPAQSADAARLHIPLPRAVGSLPRSLKGVPAKGSHAFLLKLGIEPTGRVYEANLSLGKSAASAAAKSQLATIRAAESRVIAALPSGSHVLYRMHAIMAGVGVYTKVSNLPGLQRISGVAKVYPIAPKKPSLSYSVYLVHTPQVWAATGNDLGQNSTVAIIDTGIDYTHADLGGSGNPADYTAAKASDTTAPNYPDPDKISHLSYDLAGDAYDASDTAQEMPAADPNPLDCNGHGTHVAGIVAGYGENHDGTTYTSGYTTLGSLTSSEYQALFKIGPGMAPNAKLYSYKVFGCSGSTDLVAAALDRAADPNQDGNPADHVDVVNMSLGTDYTSPQDGDSVASNTASQLGISVVAAAGNAGDLYDVGGSPGNAQRVIGVAASVDASTEIDTLRATVNGVGKAYGAQRSEYFMSWDTGDFSGETVVKLTDPADVDNQDGCDPIGTDLTGKVAFLQWTDDSAKRRCGSDVGADNVGAAGGLGVILGEDQETFAAGIGGNPDIPVVQIVKSASDEISNALDLSQTVTADSTSANDFTQVVPGDDYKVASFSSRGIRDAGDVKPDVTGAGGTVFSTRMGSGTDGRSDSGTSMATPEVAGLAALIHTQNPLWNPEEVKADIMNTAGQDLFTGDNRTGDKFAPNRVGAGQIDAKAAFDNQVLAYVADDPGAVSASFGTIEATGPMTLHKTIDVVNKDLVNPSATYDVTYDALTQVPGATYSVSPSTVALAAGETKTVILTLTIDPAQLTKTIDPTVALDQASAPYPPEFLADASGRVLLTPEIAGPPTLRVPVYSAPRPASVMTQPASLDMPSGAIQMKALPLSGTGVAQGTGDTAIQSLVSGFELQATSPALPNCGGSVTIYCIHAADEKAADIKYVGTTSNAPALESIGDDPTSPPTPFFCNPDGLCGLEYFAITTQVPWHTAASLNEYDIWIDTNRDGNLDDIAYNTRLSGTDIMVAALYDVNLGEIVDWELINDRFGNTDTALFDSDTLVMPVLISALDLSSGSRISYGVASFGSFWDAHVDLVGFDSSFNLTLSTDVLNPGVALFGSFDESGSPLLYVDSPGTSLTVRRDAVAYAADDGMGALMVHFHNAVGNKAQLVDIDHHTLSVTKTGTGSGTVTSSPSGINCGSTCSGSFTSGSSVTLTATPSAGSTFAGWSGGGCSGTGTCRVTLNATTTVRATFAAGVTLLVSKAGTGSGSVRSSPAGIACGATCSHAFASGTSVTLMATPASNSKFTGWSGGGCSGTGTCRVTLSADTTVTATFTAEVTLTVAKAGTGSGSVTSSPTGIDCGATCSHAFASGGSVTLTATAATGSKFVGWSGGDCTGTGTCQVTLTASTSVTATFKDKTPPRVTSLKVKVNHGKRTAKITFRGSDPGHSSKGLRFKCKLDKKRFTSCHSPKLYTNLRRGKHTVQVKAIDKAGNASKPRNEKFQV